MNKFISELQKVLPAPDLPACIPTKNDLRQVQKQFEMPLPLQYDDFVYRYGAGCIGDFLRVYVPNSKNIYMNLKKQNEQMIKMLRHTVHLELSIPFTDIDRVIAWGDSDNGDVLFWDNALDDDSRIVVFNPRDGDFARYTGGVCDFFVDLLSMKIHVPVFPDDFPDAKVRFEPLLPH